MTDACTLEFVPKPYVALQRCRNLGVELAVFEGVTFTLVQRKDGTYHTRTCQLGRLPAARRQLSVEDIIDITAAQQTRRGCCRLETVLSPEQRRVLDHLAGPLNWLSLARSELESGRLLEVVRSLVRLSLWQYQEDQNQVLDEVIRYQLRAHRREFINELDTRLLLPGATLTDKLLVLHAAYSRIAVLLNDISFGYDSSYAESQLIDAATSLVAGGVPVSVDALAHLISPSRPNRSRSVSLGDLDTFALVADNMHAFDVFELTSASTAADAFNDTTLLILLPTGPDHFSRGVLGTALAGPILASDTPPWTVMDHPAPCDLDTPVRLATTRASAQLATRAIGTLTRVYDIGPTSDFTATTWKVLSTLWYNQTLSNPAEAAAAARGILI